MTRAFSAVGLLAVVFVVGGLVLGDDKDTKKGVAKDRLPPGWAKLGLSDEQKQKVHDIQGEYGPKIHDLEAQIKELKNKERLELVKVLTDAQKARLGEIEKEKAFGKESKEKN
jgi:hypothetical protein